MPKKSPPPEVAAANWFTRLLGKAGVPVPQAIQDQIKKTAEFEAKVNRELELRGYPAAVLAQYPLEIKATMLHGILQRELQADNVRRAQQQTSQRRAAAPAPQTITIPWRTILAFTGTPTADEIRDRYKKLAMIYHKDHGGSDESFRLLIQARDAALKEIGAA